MRQLKITKSITDRTDSSFEQYLMDVNKIDMATPEEETELAIRIKAGDESALKRLVEANLRFVISVAKQYQHRGLSLSDIINEGNVGLIKAARKFDNTRGFKFISYAVWWVRQTIMAAITEQSRMIRLPANKVRNVQRVYNTTSDFEQRNEREPTDEELSEILDISVFEVNSAENIGKKTFSLDSAIPGTEGNSEPTRLLDMISGQDRTDDNAILHSLRVEIDRSLATLTPKESSVIQLYFGLNNPSPLSIHEIAPKFDITPERVRQIKEKAIRRLRHNSRSKILKTYLG